MTSVEKCDEILRLIDGVIGEQRRARAEWRDRLLRPVASDPAPPPARDGG